MTNSRHQETKIFNQTFLSIFIANGLMNLSQQMMNSLVPKYADFLGASASTVGIVVSMFTYTALVFKIFSAPAIDAFNRKYILMGAMLTMASAYLGYSLSYSIPMLMIARLVQGAGQAFSATSSLALATDALPKNKLGSGLGVYSVAQAICQAIGPTIGLYLVGIVGYNQTFFIGSLLMIGASVMALRIHTTHYKRKPFVIKLENIVAKEAVLPAGIVLLLSMANTAINSFLILYAATRGVANIGLFFTVYALTMLFTRPLVGRLSDRYGLWKVLIPALFFFAVSFILISFATTLPMFLLAAFISAFGYGACQPAIQTLSMKSVTPDRRGAASCTNYIGTDLGGLVGPVIAGVVIENFGYPNMWRIMLFPVFLGLILTLAKRTRIEEIEANYL